MKEEEVSECTKVARQKVQHAILVIIFEKCLHLSFWLVPFRRYTSRASQVVEWSPLTAPTFSIVPCLVRSLVFMSCPLSGLGPEWIS
jgi:hypothetical protein